MKYAAIVLLLVASALVTCTVAQNNYLWGAIGPNDLLISQETVRKTFIVGVIVEKKYVFKQKDDLNAYTITAVKVKDEKSKNGATASLIAGGPGSKGVTLLFTSQRGHNIKDTVEIYVRP